MTPLQALRDRVRPASLTPEPDPASARPGWPRAVEAYVTGVVVAAMVAAAIVLTRERPGGLQTIAVWTMAAAVSQRLSFPSLAGRGHVSLSTVVHLCMILALRPGEFLPALGLSRLVVALIERKPLVRSLFNAAQVVIAVIMGWLMFGAVSGMARFEAVPSDMTRPILGFLASGVVYYLFNVGAVSGVIALTSGSSLWAAWRANYGHRHEVVGTIALALLAPLAVVAYSAFGGIGLLSFLLPMLFLYDASVRYVALRKTQESLLRSQRQAAKAELAAGIGRDINSYLCVAQAQIQMLELRKDRLDAGEYDKRLRVAHEQLRHIDMLSRGLLDFTRNDSVIERVNLHELITNTVGFLQPQRRFNDVKLRLELDSSTGLLSADPRQIQQVLVHLLIQAAERTTQAGSAGRTITVRLKDRRPAELVEISVTDTGPAVPESVRRKMLDFGSDGPGGDIGRFIVHSVIRNHGGSISIEAPPEGGITFNVVLPCPRRPAVLPRRVRAEDADVEPAAAA